MQGERFGSIQAMRGIAATLVVLLHSVSGNASIADFGPLQHFGAIGVDLFFVISGFVMAHSMGRASPGGFLAARAVRILPTYYVFLLPEVLLLLAVGETLSAEGWLNSLALLPVASGATYHLPYLAAGWTLGFEFAFYLVVAAVVAARRGPKTLLIAVLCLAALPDGFGWAVPRWFTNDILLEFALGVLAYVVHRRIDPRLATTLGVAAGAALAAQLVVGHPPIAHVGAVTEGAMASTRALFWGVPCFGLFVAALRWTPGTGRVGKALLGLGDASYTIYLSHHMIMWPFLALLPGWSGVAAAVTLALLMGWRLHRLVEVPLTRRGLWLQARRAV